MSTLEGFHCTPWTTHLSCTIIQFHLHQSWHALSVILNCEGAWKSQIYSATFYSSVTINSVFYTVNGAHWKFNSKNSVASRILYVGSYSPWYSLFSPTYTAYSIFAAWLYSYSPMSTRACCIHWGYTTLILTVYAALFRQAEGLCSLLPLLVIHS